MTDFQVKVSFRIPDVSFLLFAIDKKNSSYCDDSEEKSKLQFSFVSMRPSHVGGLDFSPMLPNIPLAVSLLALCLLTRMHTHHSSAGVLHNFFMENSHARATVENGTWCHFPQQRFQSFRLQPERLRPFFRIKNGERIEYTGVPCPPGEVRFMTTAWRFSCW